VSGTGKLSPREAAEDMIDRVRRKADPKRAASIQRYFKEPVECYGLDTGTVRGLTKELVNRVRGSWTLRDAVAFCRAMTRDAHLEPRGIGYQVVAAFVGEARPGLLRDAKRWLEGSCGNWALVDTLAPLVVAPLVSTHPAALPEVVRWTGSSNMWLRRGAAVTFVPLARRGQHLDTAYEVARRLLGDGEDLMHKAVGWLLREAGKTDRRRLERFLRVEGSRMPRTTVRYAIERFPPDERRRWLAATRQASPVASRTLRVGSWREGAKEAKRG
jgi:3-methyladenine DNA glycosylase AlkD